MSPHPHLTYFDGDLADFRDVRLFCMIRGFQGMWQERIEHRNGKIDGTLIMVKLGDRLYRYNSPQPLDPKISQVQLGFVIRHRLNASLRYRILNSISGLYSVLMGKKL
ncbi:hypothetical protein [Chamaesiphon polymorphus]|uniref:Uncharacterized protein n=1 Tax=Chamaesiphon polymorphus CCALA 037 TaxID=2107692 RepID=A0A2T1GNY9_9CYAN|nr:hypothetical protein [Chamaesiphon polymorphus]PSB59575.1 hypothetical protein C7B77_00285 [Chamaesiphon polymorphus CCALA 037]